MPENNEAEYVDVPAAEEDVAELQEVPIEKQDPVGNPDHPYWEGHTHSYPDEPNEDGLFVCDPCGMKIDEETMERVKNG